jgi:hypothetical protein
VTSQYILLYGLLKVGGDWVYQANPERLDLFQKQNLQAENLFTGNLRGDDASEQGF